MKTLQLIFLQEKMNQTVYITARANDAFCPITPGMTRRVNCPISNGNRTEWSPIRSVIIRVINKIGRPRSGSPIC